MKRTDKIELVETHNLALALQRLYSSSDEYRWRRALYHALAMTHGPIYHQLGEIRKTLELA
jgi:hypothetical protein